MESGKVGIGEGGGGASGPHLSAPALLAVPHLPVMLFQ